MNANAFAPQLVPYRTYTYEELLRGTAAGISLDIAEKTSTAKAVLEKMEAAHLDNPAVVDNNQLFQFMVSREDILSEVLMFVVLAH